MALREPPSREQAAAKDAATRNCERSILRATGLKSTGAGEAAGGMEEWREHIFVDEDQRTDRSAVAPIRCGLAGSHRLVFDLEPAAGATPLAIAD
jgi:hypothetical protein